MSDPITTTPPRANALGLLLKAAVVIPDLIIARMLRFLTLLLEQRRTRKDVVVGALRIGGHGHAGKDKAGTESQKTDAHRSLPFLHYGGC